MYSTDIFKKAGPTSTVNYAQLYKQAKEKPTEDPDKMA